jgi:zinc/manganese transport system substrate-binding protein
MFSTRARTSLHAGLAPLVAASLGLSALLGAASPTLAAARVVSVVAAENEYASVAQAIGGRYVRVTGIMSNPNTDPHTFEANTAVAEEVAGASLVIQNGVGYDNFMNTIEAAAPERGRIVLNVGLATGYGLRTKNPHLWYDPRTMPIVARDIAADLGRLLPSDRAYFAGRVKVFDQALVPWQKAIARLRAAYRGSAVAVTEPVADDMLEAAGLSIRTPWAFQAAVMNGTDISPEDVAIEEGLLTHRTVKVFVYNQQAVDATTQSLLAVAKAHHIPVVGVYETMPPDYSYPTWMTAETNAVYKALKDHVSTERLP